MNVNFTEAKLFAIRYEIDQVIKLHDALKIVIITNTIPAMKQIFNTSIHLYQLYLKRVLGNFSTKNLIIQLHSRTI